MNNPAKKTGEIKDSPLFLLNLVADELFLDYNHFLLNEVLS